MKIVLMFLFLLPGVSFAATKTLLVDLKSSADTPKKYCYYESEFDLGTTTKSTPFQVFFNDGKSHRFNGERTFSPLEDAREHYSIEIRKNNLFLKVWDSTEINAKTCPPFADFIVIY